MDLWVGWAVGCGNPAVSFSVISVCVYEQTSEGYGGCVLRSAAG